MRWILLLAVCCTLRAQDSFEVHVYEYEPLKRGEASLETHLNGQPRAGQIFLTLEPSVGLSENFALGMMFLNAWTPGANPQFAGWRVLPHAYAPESWRLPVKVGFVAEFSFQKTRWEENSRRVELRPILDKEGEHWQVVLNPVVERALHGPGTHEGWKVEPALLVRWKRKGFSPSVEYYGQWPIHQVFLGSDWRVNPSFSVNFGAGFNVTSHGPGAVLKSRFEWDWGKPDTN